MTAQARSAFQLGNVANAVSRSLTILGSTGSIGDSTLSVVAHARANHGPHAFPIEALTAQSNVDKLATQAREFRPRLAVIGDPALYDRLKDALAGTGIEVAAGRVFAHDYQYREGSG